MASAGRYWRCSLIAIILPVAVASQSDLSPAKTAETLLNSAAAELDEARANYSAGKIQDGDERLEAMTKTLNTCLDTLNEAHKSGPFKKAELRVAGLQRRLSTLVDDIDAEHRGWAEFTSRKLEEIHDKLLEGAMRK